MDGNDDILPDILLGRISVNTVAEAETIIQKIINYEQNPPSLESFYSKAMVVGNFEDKYPIIKDLPTIDGCEDSGFPFIKICEEVRDHLKENSYDVQRIYSAPNSIPAILSSIFALAVSNIMGINSV